MKFISKSRCTMLAPRETRRMVACPQISISDRVLDGVLRSRPTIHLERSGEPKRLYCVRFQSEPGGTAHHMVFARSASKARAILRAALANDAPQIDATREVKDPTWLEMFKQLCRSAITQAPPLTPPQPA